MVSVQIRCQFHWEKERHDALIWNQIQFGFIVYTDSFFSHIILTVIVVGIIIIYK